MDRLATIAMWYSVFYFWQQHTDTQEIMTKVINMIFIVNFLLIMKEFTWNHWSTSHKWAALDPKPQINALICFGWYFYVVSVVATVFLSSSEVGSGELLPPWKIPTEFFISDRLGHILMFTPLLPRPHARSNREKLMWHQFFKGEMVFLNVFLVLKKLTQFKVVNG